MYTQKQMINYLVEVFGWDEEELVSKSYTELWQLSTDEGSDTAYVQSLNEYIEEETE